MENLSRGCLAKTRPNVAKNPCPCPRPCPCPPGVVKFNLFSDFFAAFATVGQSLHRTRSRSRPRLRVFAAFATFGHSLHRTRTRTRTRARFRHTRAIAASGTGTGFSPQLSYEEPRSIQLNRLHSSTERILPSKRNSPRLRSHVRDLQCQLIIHIR